MGSEMFPKPVLIHLWQSGSVDVYDAVISDEAKKIIPQSNHTEVYKNH